MTTLPTALLDSTAPNTAARGASERSLAWLAAPVGVAGLAGTMMSLPDIPEAQRSDAGAFVTSVLALDRVPLLLAVPLLVAAAGSLAILGSWVRTRLVEAGCPTAAQVASLGTTLTVTCLAIGAGGAAQLGWVIDGHEAALAGPAYNTVDTIPFLAWTGVALLAGAIGVASLRTRAIAKWFGILSFAVAALIGLLSAASLPFLAAFPAALWMLVAVVGLRPNGR